MLIYKHEMERADINIGQAASPRTPTRTVRPIVTCRMKLRQVTGTIVVQFNTDLDTRKKMPVDDKEILQGDTDKRPQTAQREGDHHIACQSSLTVVRSFLREMLGNRHRFQLSAKDDAGQPRQSSP